MADSVTKTQMLNNLRAVATRAKNAIEAAIKALPTEMFLDVAQSDIVSPFTFNAETYPGATDPNLNGKPVLVLVLKGVDNSDPTNTSKQTVKYGFVNMTTLVDVYKPAEGNSSKIITIDNYTITLNLSAEADNAIVVKDDGLFVKSPRVKNATAGHLAGLDADGNTTDSGVVAAEVLTTADIPTNAETNAVLDEVFGAAS